MTKKHSREQLQIQVGAFVAAGLVLLMMIIFLLGSEKRLFDTQYTLISHFADISGLRIGAPVQLAGINAGTVNKILFDEALEKKKVKLILRISKRFQDRIREDSVATIVTQGLLGDRMVFISVGSADKKILEDGDDLSARAPAGFTQLLDKGDELLGNVNEASKHINDILKEIRKGKGVAHGLIYDEGGKEMVKDFGKVAKGLSATSSNMASITGKIRRGEGTLGALVNDASLFNDLKTLLGKANRNKLIRAVVRETLRTKEQKGLKKE